MITTFVSSSSTHSSSLSSSAAEPAAVRVAPQSLAAALAELNEQEKRIDAARRGLAIDVPPAVPTGVPAAVPVAVPARSSESAPQPAAVVSGPVSPGEISLQAAAQPVEVAGAEATVAPVIAPVIEPVVEPVVEPVREIPQNPESLNFSGGLGTSESWLGKNKYILGTILVIAAVVAGIVLLR
jgi:ribonuclease E